MMIIDFRLSIYSSYYISIYHSDDLSIYQFDDRLFYEFLNQFHDDSICLSIEIISGEALVIGPEILSFVSIFLKEV